MLKKIMVLAWALLGPWMAFPGAAFAQAQQCAPYGALATLLSDQYGEAVIWQGQASATVIMQLWSNAESGTWTFVAVAADAPACMLASGQGSESIAPPPAGTEG